MFTFKLFAFNIHAIAGDYAVKVLKVKSPPHDNSIIYISN